jgi:hypothetical protein
MVKKRKVMVRFRKAEYGIDCRELEEVVQRYCYGIAPKLMVVYGLPRDYLEDLRQNLWLVWAERVKPRSSNIRGDVATYLYRSAVNYVKDLLKLRRARYREGISTLEGTILAELSQNLRGDEDGEGTDGYGSEGSEDTEGRTALQEERGTDWKEPEV